MSTRGATQLTYFEVKTFKMVVANALAIMTFPADSATAAQGATALYPYFWKTRASLNWLRGKESNLERELMRLP